MIRLRVFLITLLTMATTSTAALAAKEIGIGVTYDPRMAVGSFRDFAPDVALGGLQARWDYFPIDALSTGFEIQYNMFQRQAANDTLAIPNGALTAPIFRYASFWSFSPTARYYLSTGTIRPYVGLGAGLSSTTESISVSDISRREIGWAFIVQPSLGVLWRLSERDTGASPLGRRPLESMFGLTASVTYAFTTASFVGASNVGFVGIQVGVYAKP